jgi:hypothetical protein
VYKCNKSKYLIQTPSNTHPQNVTILSCGDVTSFSAVEIHRRFEENILPSIFRVEASNQQMSGGKNTSHCDMLLLLYLIELIFGTEDGGSTLLRNVCKFPSDCMESHLHNHRCENSKSNLGQILYISLQLSVN